MKEPILTKRFCFCFLSLFCSGMVMYMLMATITQYASEFGATPTVAGLVSGIYVAGGLCSRLYAGRGLETFGWKKLALIFSVLHLAACCFYPFITSLPLLILVRFIHGLGFGAGGSAIVTIGMSVLPKSRYGEAAGYFMLATTISVGIGPFAGGYIYDFFGGTGCFVTAILLSLLQIVFLLPVDLSGIDPGGRKGEARANNAKGLDRLIEKKAVPIACVTSLCALGYVSVMSFYRLYAGETGLTRVFSGFFLLYAFVLVFSRPFAGKLQDRHGDRVVCIPGILAQTVGLALMAWNPCTVTVILCAVGCALGFGTLNSACNVIACRNAPLSRRSYAVSTFYLCCDVGMGFGPALLGWFVSGVGYTGMYFAAAAFTLLALPLFLWKSKKQQPVEPL